MTGGCNDGAAEKITMSVILFRLKGVPDDEAQAVRRLLEENGIGYYETPGGRWGFSLAAIWLNDQAQLEKARSLLEEYQGRRAHAAKEEYERRKEEGRAETVFDRMRQDPLGFVFYVAVIVLVAYLTVVPFLGLGG